MKSQSKDQTAPTKAAVAAHEAYVARVRTAEAFPDTLPGAAHLTYAAHCQARIAGHADAPPSRGIPALYWAEEIRELKPVRVYTHRVNLVVVQRLEGNREHGLYIQVGASSYIPGLGPAIDGFTWSQLETRGVLKFTRKREN